MRGTGWTRRIVARLAAGARAATRRPRARTAAWAPRLERRCRVAPPGLAPRFRRLGYNRSDPFFPHRVYRLPKPGPDGAKLAESMAGIRDADRLWEVVLFADGEALDGFPRDLFRDPALVWHGQHFGLDGHIAFACLAERGSSLHVLGLMSDVVQRISRRRTYKSRIEKRFRGWPSLLLNAVVGFAGDRGLEEVLVPSSEWMIAHTDPDREVGPELFERVYDRTPRKRYRVRRSGRWWAVDVEGNRDRVVELEERIERDVPGPTICVCHDVERGWGHRDEDPELASRMSAAAPGALRRTLEIEASAGVSTTYHVVGAFLEDVRSEIEAGGHSLGFHSYDHDPSRAQLERCRRVDYRLRGYRPPGSVITPELRGRAPLWHGFEWIASSASSLGTDRPDVRGGIARVPIRTDDHPLHVGEVGYRTWENHLLEAAEASSFLAVGLHDCYADRWLPRYPDLLDGLSRRGRLATLDRVADALYLASAV